MHKAPDSTSLSPDADKPVCVLLAGGLARRMGGGDKPLLTLGGKTILEHMIGRLSGQCRLLVLNVNGDPARFASFGLPILADTVPDHAGPLAGVLAALDWVAENDPACPHLLSVATDTPFVPLDLVARLETARRTHGTALACAQSGERRHPPFALWPLSIRFALREALVGAQQRKMDSFMTEHGCVTALWDTSPHDPFFNINQPENLQEAERIFACIQSGKPTADQPVLLDLKGLKCPLPALKTANLLARVESGVSLKVICTDPMAQIDIPHLVQTDGHHLVAQERSDEHFVFIIRKR